MINFLLIVQESVCIGTIIRLQLTVVQGGCVLEQACHCRDSVPPSGSLGWDASIRLLFFFTYVGLIFFVQYTFRLFPGQFSKRMLWLVQGVTLFFVALVCLTPANIYTASLIPFSIFATLANFYILWAVIRAVQAREEGAVMAGCDQSGWGSRRPTVGRPGGPGGRVGTRPTCLSPADCR